MWTDVQECVAAVSHKPTPKIGRGAGPTPSRFGGASAAALATAVATAQAVANPQRVSCLALTTHLSATHTFAQRLCQAQQRMTTSCARCAFSSVSGHTEQPPTQAPLNYNKPSHLTCSDAVQCAWLPWLMWCIYKIETVQNCYISVVVHVCCETSGLLYCDGTLPARLAVTLCMSFVCCSVWAVTIGRSELLQHELRCELDSQESRAAPAVFAAAPVTAQQAQHAQQQHLPPSSPHLDDHQKIAAAAAAAAPPLQHRAELYPSPAPTPQAPTPAPTPQAPTPAPTPHGATPIKPQIPTGAPDSPTVHKSAESIVAREPVRAASKAAAKAASKSRSGDDKDGEDDVELAPEEMGFAGHSDDAFAGGNLIV